MSDVSEQTKTNILREWTEGRLTQQAIAAKYGVSKSLVSRVVREQYKNALDDPELVATQEVLYILRAHSAAARRRIIDHAMRYVNDTETSNKNQ